MSSWPAAPLGAVCDVVGGGTPSREKPEFFGGEIPWITPTDVTRNNGRYLDRGAETITELGLKSSSAKLLPARSVLLTSRATIGFTAINTVPVSTNQGFASFVCGPEVWPEFLAYWLEWSRDYLIGLASGATFKEINKSTLRKLSIPLPPLKEQRRIVGLLDRAAEIRRSTDAARSRARAIIPALFLDTFGDPATNPKGWPMIDFESAADDITRFVPKIMRRDYAASGSYPIYDQGQVEVPGYTDDQGSTYSTSEPVILFGDHTRVFRLVSGRFARGADGVRLFRTTPGVAPDFLRTYLELHGLPNAGYSRHYRFLKEVRVTLPPLPLQTAFAEQVQRLEALARVLDAACAKAEAMAAALSAEVFHGRPTEEKSQAISSHWA